MSLLSATRLFQGLPPDAVAGVAAGSTIRRMRRNHVIFEEGDPASELFLVQEGRIAIANKSTDGRESVVALMESASLKKPRLAQLADRAARPFLVAVLAAAALAAAFWWPVDPGKALMVAVAVLVVTCPCALSLATPAAMLASAGLLARGGVLVASRVNPGGRRIEIWDTGVGIAPVYQREIFREFYKVPAHAGTEDGFGLGLYIVKTVAERHNGSVSARSRPGEGAEFEMILPMQDSLA